MTTRGTVMARVLPLLLFLLLGLLLLLTGCGSDRIVFNYPGEQIDFKVENLRTPSVYMDLVTDMRPRDQREGRGHFLTIDFPKDSAWERDVTEIYAEALAQDVEQTHLVEIVPLRGQADYVLSADILSLGCQFKRSAGSFLVPALLGGGLGLALGQDGSDRTKLGVAMGLGAVLAVPMPSRDRAEAEIRLTLRDRSGNILWQKSCLGEYSKKVFAAATSRQDQRFIDEHLTKAVKRANACLLGQMRQFLLEQSQTP